MQKLFLNVFILKMDNNDPFAEFDQELAAMQSQAVKTEENSEETYQRRPMRDSDGNFADELLSRKIEARNRTFFIDLKKSTHGKFLKISEKSRGKKSTIIMDAEDVPAFIEAMEDVRSAL